MSFATDLQRFAERASGNIDQVHSQFALEVATSVAERTPVGNPSLWSSPPPKGYVGGRLRANWQFTEGAPATGTLTTTDYAGTMSRLTSAIGQTHAGGVVYLVNNIVYGPVIEYEGHSSQAPAGMVRLTVAEAEQYLRRAAGSITP